MKKDKANKEKIKNYYWLIAGVIVGIYTILMTSANFILIMPGLDGNFSGIGMIAVMAEYVAILYLLNIGQKRL